MGEMTIRLDDALILALHERAELTGTPVDHVAAELLQFGLADRPARRMAVSRAILARNIPSPISSVDLLDQIRDEGR